MNDLVAILNALVLRGHSEDTVDWQQFTVFDFVEAANSKACLDKSVLRDVVRKHRAVLIDVVEIEIK